jgi:catalase
MHSSVPPGSSPDEAGAIAAIVASVERTLARQYPPGTVVRRDAHPKHHGVVRASFEVSADLPAALRHGVFAAPDRFDAWVRFSNGAPRVQPDRRRDQRGMAIKLLGVPGPKVLVDERDAPTQDFVLASAPRFFIRDVASYAAFTEAASKEPAIRVFGYFFGPNPFAWRLHELRALLSSLRPTADLLSTKYWSQVPSRLGPHVVKYAAQPLDPSPWTTPGTGPDFLRARLVERLGEGDAQFQLYVQRYVDDVKTPIEDATIEWRESDAPLEPVAALTIPRQAFDSPDQMALAEHLSFTPWHTLPAHEPVGAMNRTRRVVYEAISRYRHAHNGVPRIEPRSLEIDRVLITPQQG